MKSLQAREKAILCAQLALDKKAYDVVVLDVAEHTSLADFFVICTGRSDTQVQAIMQSIQEGLTAHGSKPQSVEGYTRGQWIIMDYADVVVHVFFEPMREFYDLDRLWTRAARVPLPEPYNSQAQDLRLAERAR